MFVSTVFIKDIFIREHKIQYLMRSDHNRMRPGAGKQPLYPVPSSHYTVPRSFLVFHPQSIKRFEYLYSERQRKSVCLNDIQVTHLMITESNLGNDRLMH